MIGKCLTLSAKLVSLAAIADRIQNLSDAKAKSLVIKVLSVVN